MLLSTQKSASSFEEKIIQIIRFLASVDKGFKIKPNSLGYSHGGRDEINNIRIVNGDMFIYYYKMQKVLYLFHGESYMTSYFIGPDNKLVYSTYWKDDEEDIKNFINGLYDILIEQKNE